MAKVVIIAPSDVDLTDAIKILKAEGHDVDFEEPTPKSLLHIVLGLFGGNAYGFGPGYVVGPGGGGLPAPEDEAPVDEVAVEDDVTAEPDPDRMDIENDFTFSSDAESIGDEFNFEDVTVDGEKIVAEGSPEAEQTTLVLSSLSIGPKTAYKINESKFSFWPNNQEELFNRVIVRNQALNKYSSLEVRIVEGEEDKLLIGKDIIGMFKSSEKRTEAAPEQVETEKSFGALTKEEVAESATRAGIIDEDGKLTETYK